MRHLLYFQFGFYEVLNEPYTVCTSYNLAVITTFCKVSQKEEQQQTTTTFRLVDCYLLLGVKMHP